MGRELAAHVQYLQISAWFMGEGLPELARFFADQAAEEHDHALRFLHYLEDAAVAPEIPAIEAPRHAFETAEDAIGHSVEQELAVTRYIDELVTASQSRGDHATTAFLQWFVTEQVEEVATMSELLQVVRRAGEGGLLLVEDHVARRRERLPQAAEAG
jgi:ferritin